MTASSLMPWSAITAGQCPDPADDLFASWLWFDILATAARPRHYHPAALIQAGSLLPLWCVRRANRLIPAASLTSPYSLTYQPPGDPAILAPLLTRSVRSIVRLDALIATDPLIPALEQHATEAGLITHRFEHFTNWSMPVAADFTLWLAGRPGALRNTIKRRLKARDAPLLHQFGFATGPGCALDLTQAITQFDAVYAQSWKPAEPFADINRIMMQRLAQAGVLRVGILATPDGPIAAQYWAISGRCAYLLKLAHLKSATASSPGTTLTALMIKTLLTAEPITHLDFGRGDDRYKRDWVCDPRTRLGLLLINRASPTGLAWYARLRLTGLARSLVPRANPASPA